MTLPDGVERDYPLARLTTVRAGGPADLFARPDDERDACGAAPLGGVGGGDGRSGRLGLEPSGLRRRYRGLVVKLDGELSAIERQGTRVVCGAAPGFHAAALRRLVGDCPGSSSGSTSRGRSAAR